MRTFITIAALLVAISPLGAEPPTARGLAVEAINDRPSFLVRVDVDHADRVYRVGDVVRVTVRSERAGYLYLFYCDADRAVSCVFPNAIQTDHRIEAAKPIEVPAAEAKFRLRVKPPLGTEVLKALVTTQPLRLAGLQVSDLTKGDATPIRLEQFEKTLAEARDRATKGDREWAWAEHSLTLTTIAERDVRPTASRRIGVFIGVGKHLDSRIPGLRSAGYDPRHLADAMKATGCIDEALVLIDEQATRAKIEEGMRKWLVANSRAGDTVVLYFSGHGGRCADDNGDEKDGFDEYLVPYDAKIGGLDDVRKTMILDDTFGRWLQELDGRRVLVILDCCYASGQSEGGKSLGGPTSDAEFDFLDGEVNRAKDLGQANLALLASSKASEISFMKKGSDLSVMTALLAERLQQGSDELTLRTLFEHLARTVPEYVKRTYPGATQTPVLLDLPTSLVVRSARPKQ